MLDQIVTNLIGYIFATAVFGIMYYFLKNIPPFCDYLPGGMTTYYTIIKPKDDTTFDDIIGCDEIKQNLLTDIQNFESDTEKHKFHGYIFHGTPGTGKTMMLRAIVGHVKYPVIQIIPKSVSQQQSMKLLIAHIRRNYAPCYILLDEGINYINNESDYLLSAIDGIETIDDLFIIITSNGDEYNEALYRSGRFEKKYQFTLPDEKVRKEFFMKKLAGISDDILNNLVASTYMLTFADLNRFVNEYKNGKTIDDINKENLGIRLGKVSQRITLDENEKIRLVYHELGHFIVSYLLGIEVIQIKVKPHNNKIMGLNFNKEGSKFLTKTNLINHIAIQLGASVCETIMLGEYATTCLQDMKIVDEMLTMMRDCKMIVYSDEDRLIQHIKREIEGMIGDNQKLVEKIYNIMKDRDEINVSDLTKMLEIESWFGCRKISPISIGGKWKDSWDVEKHDKNVKVTPVIRSIKMDKM